MELSFLWRFLSSIISVYLVIIFIRILLTWFRGPQFGRPYEILTRITDPYLQYFRRFPALRTGRIDFSPLAAILVLVVIQNIFRTLAAVGSITIGIILSILVSAGWSAFSFLLTFLFIIILIRIFTLFTNRNSSFPMFQTLDYIIDPIRQRIINLFKFKQPLSYQAELGITAVLLLAVSIAGRILINFLIYFLRSLPF